MSRLEVDSYPPWRVLGSRTIVSDKWLTLRAENCEIEGGAILNPYYLVTMPDAVATVVVTEDRKLVLVRQYRHGCGAVTLELPAGAIDEGEAPITAARRELAEETGYEGGSAELLRSFAYHTERFTNRMHGVLIQGAMRTAKISHDHGERIETVLWRLDRAQDLLLEPSFANPGLAGVLAIALQRLS